MDKCQWAEHLLRDEGFQAMMEELRSVELSRFAMSAASEANVREDAYYQLRALEKIEAYLEGLSAQKLIDEKRLKIL
jgi:hypothetical protein